MENTPFFPDVMFKKIQSLSFELFIALPLRTLKQSYKTISIGWKPPPISFYKLNTNGSVKSNLGMSGVGGLIRYHRGNWIGGFLEA